MGSASCPASHRSAARSDHGGRAAGPIAPGGSARIELAASPPPGTGRAGTAYALPLVAVQARIELARVHLALAGLAGARALMREAGEIPQPGGRRSGELGLLEW